MTLSRGSRCESSVLNLDGHRDLACLLEREGQREGRTNGGCRGKTLEHDVVPAWRERHAPTGGDVDAATGCIPVMPPAIGSDDAIGMAPIDDPDPMPETAGDGVPISIV